MKIPRGLCQCGCGGKTKIAERTITTKHHRKGQPQPFIRGHNIPKHGFCTRAVRAPEYNSYLNAKQRCTNPNHTHYAWYGARGIEFRFNSFEEFYAELGPRPEPKRLYSVDRKDNNKHYEVGNVKWSTRKEQSQNRRKWGTCRKQSQQN